VLDPSSQIGTRNPAPGTARTLVGLQRSQQGLQFHDIMGKILGGRGQIPAQRARGTLIGAGCAAEPEIDAAPVKRFQRTELLCDDQRRMIWQHHAARSNTNGPGAAGDIADHHRGRSAGDAGHIVMLGKPEPLVIPAFGVLRQIERIAEGLGRIAALINRRQVQNREGNHRHLQFSDNLVAKIAGTRQMRSSFVLAIM
jgi:hypothetical protein